MKKKVTVEGFIEVFRDQWDDEVNKKNSEDIRRAYKKDPKWTEFMLGKDRSFLEQVSGRLSLEMGREWNKMDCVYYEKEPDLYGDDEAPYPACLHVYIEHENGNKVEQEMWKMLMVRSPLKVLIFYDYREDLKNKDTKKTCWLQKKLKRLLCMGKQAHDIWPEADNTEYLFLVGTRKNAEELPRWRYLTVKGECFGDVSKSEPLDLC